MFFLGKTPELIVVSRAIQGASTTFVWVSGLAFLVSQVGEGDLGEYVGWTTVGVAVGEVVGPLLGGPVYDSLGHWAVFGMTEAILVVDILLRLFVKEKTLRSDTEALGAREAEANGLLQDGRGNSTDYDTTHSGAGERESTNSIMRLLAWNWLGTVFSLVVIFLVRGALEVVSR